MSDFIDDLGATFAWLGTALALMAVGFAIVDLLTPGNLRKQVGDNFNAAVLVGAKLVSVGIIVLSAVVTADDSLDEGLLDAALYGALGIVVSAAVFLAIDWLLPTRLRDLVSQAAFAPATCVAVGAELGVALVVAAASS